MEADAALTLLQESARENVFLDWIRLDTPCIKKI